MKNSKYYILGIVLLMTMSFVTLKPWYLLTATAYGFKIEFPEKPTEKAQSVNSAVGKLKMNMYMLEPASKNQDENLVYLVNYTEYPEGTVDSNDKENLDGFFRNSIDGAVANVNGKLVSEKNITLGKYPGREAKVDFQNGLAVITMRIYLVNNTMYMLETICETKKDSNASITKFMDSFALTVK